MARNGRNTVISKETFISNHSLVGLKYEIDISTETDNSAFFSYEINFKSFAIVLSRMHQ